MLLMRLVLVFSLIVLVSSCGGMQKKQSDLCGDRPCWVVNSPKEGIVVSMADHVDPNKTREVLFNKALVELAAESEGFNVSQDSIVKKNVVNRNGNMSETAQVVTLANVNTGGGETRIQAKIKGQWKDPYTRKLYLWVVKSN